MTLRRLGNWRLAGFVAPEAPMQALLAPLFVYVPPFYAAEMGLGLPVAGAIFGATKLFDVLTDPV